MKLIRCPDCDKILAPSFPMHNCTPERKALKILRDVRSKLGRNYKSAIRQAWMNGNYSAVNLGEFSSELQNIRNTYGPTWLVNARPMPGLD